MNKQLLLYLCLACIIVGLAVGFPLGLNCGKKNNISTKIGKETIDTTVTVHDTIATVKTSKDAVATKEKVKIIRKVPVAGTDSAKRDSNVVPDSLSVIDSSEANCYTVKYDSAGVHVVSKVCSKEFPAEVPSDFTNSLKFKLPNDTSTASNRIDTTYRDVSTPIYKSPWTYVLILATAVLTYIGTHK